MNPWPGRCRAAGTLILAAAACAQAVEVTIVRIDGETIAGTVEKIALESGLRLRRQSKPVDVPLESILQVTVAGPTTTSAPAPDSQTFHLRGGGRLGGKIIAESPGGIRADTSVARDVAFSFKQLTAIRFKPDSDAPEAAKRFAKALAEPKVDQDVVVMIRDGKTRSFRGLIERLSAAGGVFRYRDRTLSLQPEYLFGIVLATGVQKPDPSPLRVELTTGEAIDGSLEAGDADGIVLRTPFASRVEIPWNRVSRLSFRSDRVVFLSDLTPTVYRFKPYFNIEWPYRMDQTVGLGPIQMAGRRFAKGIGVHSACRLSFDRPPGFNKLVGIIGIDDAVRPRGEVIFRVTSQGRELFNSGPVTGNDQPRPISVDLPKAETVNLVVEYGGGMDIADHADWADIRFVK